MGPVWNFLKLAAARIPWGQVVEGTPLLMDAIGRARARGRVDAELHANLEEHLRALNQENERLTADLRRVSQQVQQLNARVSLLSKVAGLSLLTAVSALILALVR